MTFPQITIPDPAAVGKWLDEQLGAGSSHSNPSFSTDIGWHHMHWLNSCKYVSATGDNPESLLADLKAKIAENDPLAKIRKEAEAHGYALMKLPTD